MSRRDASILLEDLSLKQLLERGGERVNGLVAFQLQADTHHGWIGHRVAVVQCDHRPGPAMNGTNRSEKPCSSRSRRCQ